MLKKKHSNQKLIDQRGLGLVETLIAVSLAIIVVTALVSLAVFALRNSRQSSYTAQATQIAQNQLELLRAYRDNSTVSWATFTNLTSGSCTTVLPTTCGAPTGQCYYPITATTGNAPTTGAVGSSSPFTWSINISNVSNPATPITVVRAGVVVHWSVGGKSQCVYNYTDFTNWRGK